MKVNNWIKDPGLLLITTGLLFGMNFPFAKLATQAQIPALIWIMSYSLGATLALAPIFYFQKNWRFPNRRQFLFVAISGPLAFAGPNLLVYFVVPKIGAGYGGIMFALSPVFTVLFGRLLGLSSPGALGYLGILLGLVGVAGITLSTGQFSESGSIYWFLLAMVIPLILAGGNIYRSLAWPEGVSPELIAFWSHSFSFVCYLLMALVLVDESVFTVVSRGSLLVLVQVVIAGLAAPIYFRLQRYGGPVMLSQIGYVSAAVSLIVATVALGERYALISWICAMVIAAGIVVTISSQRKRL